MSIKRLPKVILVRVNSHIENSLLTYPIGLLLLKALLIKEFPGIAVNFLDNQNQTNDQTVREILAQQPDMIGFSVTPGSMDNLAEVTGALDQAGAFNQALKVFGNIVPTFAGESMLEIPTYSDGVMVRSWGEAAMLGLVDNYLGQRSLAEVPGITYRDSLSPQGKILQTQMQAFNLAELPLPDITAMKQTLEAGGEVWLELSRICNSGCNFCTQTPEAREMPRQEYDLDYAKKLIEAIGENGISGIHFADDNFVGNNPARVAQIGQLFKKYAPECRWAIDTRADAIVHAENVFPGFWQNLAEAGLAQVYIGFDSGSQTQRILFNKGGTVERDYQATRILTNADITVMGGFIQLNPWSTRATVADNIRYLRDGNLARFKVKPLRLLRLQKGSVFFEQAARDGLLLDQQQDLIYHNYKFKDPHANWLAYYMEEASFEDGGLSKAVELMIRAFRYHPELGATVYEMEHCLQSMLRADIDMLDRLNNLDPANRFQCLDPDAYRDAPEIKEIMQWHFLSLVDTQLRFYRLEDQLLKNGPSLAREAVSRRQLAPRRPQSIHEQQYWAQNY